MIYLDNAATTALSDNAYNTHIRTLRDTFGNPASLHRPGSEARKEIKKARRVIAGSFGCDEKEVIFTSCATESINMVLKTFFEHNTRASKRILTSSAEHKATLETCSYLEKKGVHIDHIGITSDGTLDESDLIEKMKEGPGLISFIHVNNETGAVSDISRICEIRDIYCPEASVHIDAAQSYGKFKLKPKETGIQYISVSAHKIHGPKGIGALFADTKTGISPFIHGGGQENGLRSGTQNAPAIASFGAAAGEAFENLEINYDHAEKVRNAFVDRLEKTGTGFFINSPNGSSPYILNISFPEIKPEVLLHILESKGVIISTGSACSSRRKVKNHVLEAMHVSSERIAGSVRISFSRYNTVDEAIVAADKIKESLPGARI